MKRITLALTVSDNGCLSFYGPLNSLATKQPVDPSKQRQYVARSLKPLEVGQTLLAIITDLQLTTEIKHVDQSIEAV